MTRIGIVGVGKLGQDCGEVIAAKGFRVVGYDIEKRKPANFAMVPSIRAVVENSDIIFVSVPTAHDPSYGGETPSSHLEPKDFDYSAVCETLIEINKWATAASTVVLISTVLPGTTRRLLKDCVPDIELIYNPYLIAMGSVKWDMVNPEMIIIGTESGKRNYHSNLLESFYAAVMENSPRVEFGTWEEAESIKIFYNTWISTKIALANMVLDVSSKLGHMNVDNVNFALARSTQRIMSDKYMVAGGPDAGACHPRDNIALRWLSKELDLGYDLFSTIMTAREQQTLNIAKFVDDNRNGLPVVIVGKAYKPGVEYLHGSGSVLLGHYLKELDIPFVYLDINTGDDPVLDYPACYVLMHNAQVTYSDSPLKDSVISQKIAPMPGSVVVDIWRKSSREEYPASVNLVKFGDRFKK